MTEDRGIKTTEPKSEAADLPAELPVLVIKGGVVFPGLVSPLLVSTDRSARLVDEALTGNKLVCAVAQRDPALEGETAPKDLFEVGTAAVILRMLRLGDGTMRLLLQGVRRARVAEYVATEPYLRGRVEPLEEREARDTATQALMRSVVDLFQKVAALAPYINEDMVTALVNIDSPSRLADFVAMYASIELPERSACSRRWTCASGFVRW